MPLHVEHVEMLEIQIRRPGVNPSLVWNCALCGRSRSVGELTHVTVRLEGNDLEVRDIAVCDSCLGDLTTSS